MSNTVQNNGTDDATAALSRAKVMSNYDAASAPSHDDSIAQLTKAFSDDKKSGALAGSAVQRGAYGIMGLYREMQVAGEKIAALASVPTSAEAAKDIKARMVSAVLGERPNTKDETDDDKAKMRDNFTAQSRLVERATILAGVLSNAGVSFAAFNAKTGCFNVPVSMLLAADDEGLGVLRTAETVALDNRSYMAIIMMPNGKTQAKSIQASVKRVQDNGMPRTKRATGGAASDKSKDKDKSDNVPTDVAAMIHHTCDILCLGSKDAPAHVRKDAFPDEVWNDLAAIAAWYNKQVSHPKFNEPSDGHAKPRKSSKAA
jgi:hypothetical protein